ncbi:hypothetical protein GCM10020331_098430 [Ectobacillus funiculus]
MNLCKKDDHGNIVTSKIHHFGMLAVLDQPKGFGDAFIDDAKADIIQRLPIRETVFNGYIVSKNDFNTSVYTFFKTEALPTRLAKGLVEEYKEYQEKKTTSLSINNLLSLLSTVLKMMRTILILTFLILLIWVKRIQRTATHQKKRGRISRFSRS